MALQVWSCEGGRWTSKQLTMGRLPLQNVHSVKWLPPRVAGSGECTVVAGMNDGQLYVFKGATALKAIAAHAKGPQSIQPDGHVSHHGVRGMCLVEGQGGGAAAVQVDPTMAPGAGAQRSCMLLTGEPAQQQQRELKPNSSAIRQQGLSHMQSQLWLSWPGAYSCWRVFRAWTCGGNSAACTHAWALPTHPAVKMGREGGFMCSTFACVHVQAARMAQSCSGTSATGSWRRGALQGRPSRCAACCPTAATW